MLAPVVADFATSFGPPEYVALMAVAFVTVSALLGADLLKGVASLLVGVGLGLVGIDAQTGQARMSFGADALLDGVDVVVVVIALFALSEAFGHLLTGTGISTITPVRERVVLSRQDLRRSWPAWLRGTALGFPIGSLPAGGAKVPTFLGYTVERRLPGTARSSAAAPSRGWSVSRRPTTPPRPGCWCRC